MTNELDFLKEYDNKDGMFVLKRDHTVVYWNDQMQKWSNIETEKILMDKIFLYFENLDSGLIQELFESIFKSAIELTLPYPKYQNLIPCYNENNELRKFKISVKPIKNNKLNDIFYIFYLEEKE